MKIVKVYHSGEAFGDIALITHEKRFKIILYLFINCVLHYIL